MKVGIEVQRLFRRRKHGMEIVALEIIRQLQNIDQTNDYLIFSKEDEDTNCLNATPNFQIVATAATPYPVWEQWLLPKLAAKNKLDLLHCTSNTAPILGSTPLIITLHDIIFLEKFDFSGSHYQNFGNLYRRVIVPRVINKARIVITVSEYARQLIIQRLNMNNEKVRVIHNAVNSIYRKINDEEEITAFKIRQHLPKRFLLHFSNTAPRKNTIGLLKAFVLYCQNTKAALPLVITNCSRKNLVLLLKSINAAEFFNNITCLDYVAADDLPYLYNAATIFLYPSFNEGFGLPVIESMACGTPVITSNTSSLPEVAGNAASLIDPYDHAEIADKITELLSNEKMYAELQERGFINAARFSWKIAAEKTLALYEEIRKTA